VTVKNKKPPFAQYFYYCFLNVTLVAILSGCGGSTDETAVDNTAPVITLNGDSQIVLIQWGDIRWLSMNNAFLGCVNLVGNASDSPNFSQVTDMSGMFSVARSFNQDISNWDVSSVTDMTGLFQATTNFNQDLSNWDVSSVTNMSLMLANAGRFDQDISGWDVSSVTDMEQMLSGITLSTTNYDALLLGWSM